MRTTKGRARSMAWLLAVGSWGCGHAIVEQVLDAGCPPVGLPEITASDPVTTVTSSADRSIVLVDLGAVTLHRTGRLELGNQGCADVTILAVSGRDQYSFSMDLEPGQTIRAGGPALPVVVDFTHGATEFVATQFVVTTNSPEVPTIAITVTATGIDYVLSVAPKQLDFRNVSIGTTATQSVALTNHSGVDLTLTVGRLEGADPAPFAVKPPVGTVVPLGNGETQSLEVDYSPEVASPTPSQAFLHVQSCVRGNACLYLVVDLSGASAP